MVREEINEVFVKAGYRFCKGKPEETGIYYKYYQEGFHVVIAIDLEHGYEMTPEQHHIMEERLMGSFYHPEKVLADFPDGFPVYHVETLTLIIGGPSDQMRRLCSQCQNIWAYLPKERRLLIYENQPGDFFGLRQRLEELQNGHEAWSTRQKEYDGKNAANGINLSWKEKIRYGKNLPYVTLGLMAVNVIVYLVMELAGNTRDGLFVASYGGMYPTFLLYNRQWWRLLTAGFIHFGAAHLVNNMIILYCMGSRLERTVGHLRLFLIYILSLLGGSLLSFGMMCYTGDYAVSAGASGAIFGIIGGFLWALILHRGHLEGITVRGMIFMIVLMIYYGFSSSGIDNWGHIGGMMTGLLITAILYHRKCQKY